MVEDLQRDGSEQTAIDDLLKRMEAYVEGGEEASVKGKGGDVEVYEDEYDEELFGIFIDQLKDGLQALAAEAQRLGRGESAEAALERCADRLGSLRSSANYMGYEHLKRLYEQWIRSVGDYRGRVSGGEKIDGSVRDEISANIARIKSLFPTVKALQEMDLQIDSDDGQGSESRLDTAEPELALFSEGGEEISEAEMASEPEKMPDPAPEAESQSGSATSVENSLLSDFITETGEHLEQTERNLLRLEQQPGDLGLLNEVFRSIHTIKGSSEYLGMERIAELSHKLEGVLDLLRRGDRRADRGMIDILIDTNDRLGTLVEDLQRDGSEQTAIDDLIGRIEHSIIQLQKKPDDEVPASAKLPQDCRKECSPIYEEQYDKDLFEIFKNHLQSGLEGIETGILKLGTGEAIEKIIAECLDQLSRLRSSANYMEYEELCSYYDKWIDNLNVLSGNEISDQDELRKTIGDKVRYIRSLFEISAPEISMNSMESGIPASESGEDGSESHEISEIGLEEGMPPDTLLSELESAFEAKLGNSRDTDENAYPIDIENALLSEGGPFDLSASSIHRDDYLNHEKAAPESVLFSDQEPESEPDEPINTYNFMETAESNKDLRETTGDRRNFNRFGRRKSDKFGEKLQKNSIRVDAAKIDTLMNQVGELVVSRSGFAQLINDMRELHIYLKRTQKLNRDEMQQIKVLTGRISDATLALGRVTSELQENVMKVRMLPIAQLFSRYPRLVHDLVRSTNKKVELEVHGEETELDKMVIEQIADPLVHIIRNAVDHGIEAIEERRRKGKEESGRLRLEAYHEGNFVVIEISDDGRGLDPDKIRMCALEKGFIGADEMREMNDQEILRLIMRPGFSTAQQVTHTSGRGVGMDVVKEYVDKLNGTIEIISTTGIGTCFKIKIPLTLAIIPALLVGVGEEVFTIPLANVDETIRIRSSEISTIEGVEIYSLRDVTIPLIRLTKLFNMIDDGLQDELFVVIINMGAKRVGLVVDELRARDEVVIKPLEDYLQEKSGFAGATILGDGSISLILDVFELVNLSVDQHSKRTMITADHI